MSTAIVKLTVHLQRFDHSKKLTNEAAMALAESELDGSQWWDDDYRYDVTVMAAEVEVNESRV